MSIYEQRLQQDSSQIRNTITEMGKKAELAIKNAMQALFTGDEALANQVILQDNQLDYLCNRIDRNCHTYITRHQPVAIHLRLISSSLRMIYDLERIGDYAVNIAKQSLDLPHPPTGSLKQKMEGMLNNASTMLQQALTAYEEENADLARATMALNLSVSKSLGTAFASLIQEGDSVAGHSRELLDQYTIFSMLERIGNRATNLCEETLYWLHGENEEKKALRIVFLGGNNNIWGFMAAEAVKRRYDDTCVTATCVGQHPDNNVHPHFKVLLTTIGFDLPMLDIKGVETLDLSQVDLLISLQGSTRSYVPKIPFHTAFLDWDLGSLEVDFDNPSTSHRRFEEIYRHLLTKLAKLMETIHCMEAH